jgi:hypothetical protein
MTRSLSRIEGHDNGEAFERRGETTWDVKEQVQRPAQDFGLSSFGLPEPAEVSQPSHSGWYTGESARDPGLDNSAIVVEDPCRLLDSVFVGRGMT